jgi:hypothetical protein
MKKTMKLVVPEPEEILTVVDWLDERVRSRTDRGELPEVITPDFGVGIKFKDDKGIEYTTVASNGVREITLTVHTYKGGFCYEAIHYYGRLEVGETSLEYIQENGKPYRGYIGGSFDRFKPEGVKGIDIQIHRLLTDAELVGNKDKDHRFHGSIKGDMTNAYEDEIELYNDAVNCIKARFAGDWMVRIDGFDNEDLCTCYSGQSSIPLAELTTK